MAKNKKNMFVYASGIFGKYFLRGLIYLLENLIAFIIFLAIVAAFAGIAYAMGLSTTGIVAAVTAATVTMPVLTQLAIFAIPVAAGEIIKKIYKDNLEWIVTGYKNFIGRLFTPTNFKITPEELAIKREKHPEPEKAAKYATLESYEAAKKAQYDLKNLDKTYLDVVGKSGKRAFKSAAVSVSSGMYWLATAPSRITKSWSADQPSKGWFLRSRPAKIEF